VAFAQKISKIDGQPATLQNRAHLVRLDMPLDHPLMRHPPMAQLLQDRGFARHRHPARPLTVYPQPENAPGGKRQIDQLDPELVLGLEISNDHAIMRFGAGHAPFYLPKAQNASKKSKQIVHATKFSAMHPIASNSR